MSLLTKSTTSTKQNDVASERSSEMIEFRCNRCWQSNVAECELTGNAISCRSCGHETTVPEATPERIARAQSLLQEGLPEVNPYAAPQPYRELSSREIVASVERDTRIPLREIDFKGYSTASIWSRLCAQTVDGMLFSMTLVAGIAIVIFLAKQGYIENPQRYTAKDVPDLKTLGVFSLIFVAPLFFVLTQWALVARQGQTIGKMLLSIRVVTMRGKLPGFFRGVFLRVWLRVALSCIPLFGLIDLLFGLGASRRCIHDLLSGTRVVESN